MEKDKNKGIYVFLITILCFFSTFLFFLIKMHKDNEDAKKIVSLEEQEESSSIVDRNAYTLMSFTTGGKYEEGFSNASHKMVYDFEVDEEKKVSDLKEESIAFLTYQYASNHGKIKKTKQKELYLTEKDAKEIHSTLFGREFSYQEIEAVTMCPKVTLDKTKKRYIYQMDCGMSTDVTLYSKILNTKKQGNLFYIEELVGYYVSAFLDNNVFSTYKDAINKENSIGTISESTEVQIKGLQNSLAKYRYTFINIISIV